MANRLYTKARESFLKGEISWSSDTIKCCLASASYSANTSTDQYLSDIPGGDIIATSAGLGSKATTGGTADAADVTFTAVAGGSTGTQLVIYQDTGVAGTSRLIALIDTATNLPVVTNGGDITVSWDNGSNKIFTL